MKKFWENDGNPNEEGLYVARIDFEDGTPMSVYKGRSHQEVADKILDANTALISRNRELKSRKPVVFDEPVAGRDEAPTFERRDLTAQERNQVARAMTDPTQAPEAIRTVMEAEFGAPVEEVREALRGTAGREAQEQTVAAGKEFMRRRPHYGQYRNDRTAKRIADQILLQRIKAMPPVDPELAFTAEEYCEAFDALLDEGLLVANTSASRESTTDTIRPRGTPASSGLRNGQARGTAPPARPKAGYTREEIDKMPLYELRSKINSDPAFRAALDKMDYFGQPAGARA